MAIQTWEMLDVEGYDGAPTEHDSENLGWFKIIIASGTFAVKACCSDTALFKSDAYAENLRNSNRVIFEVGNGLPFITKLSGDDLEEYERTWFEGKPDVILVEYRYEASPDTELNLDDTKATQNIYDNNQGVIFTDARAV